MFSFELLIGFIAFVGNLFLGVFTLLKNYKSTTNKLFFFFSISISIYIVFNYLSIHQTSDQDTLTWVRLIMFIALILNLFYFLLVTAFPHSQLRLRRRFYLALIIYTLLLLPLTQTPLIYKSVEVTSRGTNTVIGPAMPFFLIHTVLFLGGGFIVLIQKYRKAHGTEKMQTRLFLLGSVFMFIAILVTNMLFVLVFKTIAYSSLLPIYSLIFIGFISYAIIRHRFLDLRIAVRRGFAQFLIVATVVGLFFIFEVFYFKLKGIPLDYSLLMVFVFAAFVLSLIYEPIAYGIRAVTNRYLFSGIYDQSELIRDLSTDLNSTLGFEDVLKKIYQTLSENMHIRYAVFVVKLEGRKDVPSSLVESGEYVVYRYGDHIDNLTIPSYFSQILQKQEESLLLDDLQTEAGKVHTPFFDQLKNWMVENESGVVLPLRIKNESIGAIVLGEKMSGEAFTSEDVNVLETFSLQAAIGIENILLFMHSRDFNERLKLEVETATVKLKQKNRNLEVLRKMDSIITNTLDLKEMCQKIVDTISVELGYDGALISLVDEKNKQLVPTAVSQTPKIKKALSLLPKPMSSFTTSMSDSDAIAIQAINSKRKIASTSLAEAFRHVLPTAISDAMQAVIGLKGIVIYPLITKDRPLGVMSLAMHTAPKDLPEDEQSLLDAFMDEAGIALENAYLYEEARKANAALQVSNQKLIELDQMKDEFVSVASHELRTPMTAINGYVWMVLQGRGGDLTDKQKNYLTKVAQSTQRLINLVNDMLSVSRLEGGRIHIDMKKFDLVDLIKTANEELQIKADERNLSLLIDSANSKVEVYADPDKTHEILINLIGNALKFTEKGSITTQLVERAGMIVVNVIDTGKGIAPEDMSKLFQKFGRLDNQYATVAETTGTGLGLYICKKYVELMGGTVSAHSEVDKGSTFTFTLKKG
jgi:signal transduction histidine kinase